MMTPQKSVSGVLRSRSPIPNFSARRVSCQGAKVNWPDRGQPFDIAKSEVVGWLISQPEIQDWLFERLKESQAIVFDAATRTWSGHPAALRNSPEAHVPPGGEEASFSGHATT